MAFNRGLLPGEKAVRNRKEESPTSVTGCTLTRDEEPTIMKRLIWSGLPLFLLASLALSQVATGVIPGREWPATKFTLD